MKKLALVLLCLAFPAVAQNEPVEIQVSCGTLSGKGAVRLSIGGTVVMGPFVISCGTET